MAIPFATRRIWAVLAIARARLSSPGEAFSKQPPGFRKDARDSARSDTRNCPLGRTRTPSRWLPSPARFTQLGLPTVVTAGVLLTASPVLAATERTTVHVAIAFPTEWGTRPASDAPPRVLECAAIQIPSKVAAVAKPGTGGRFTIRVDEAGAVHDLEFAKDASPGGLARPIRQALAGWKFEPFRCGGEVKAVTVPLAYLVDKRPALDGGESGEAAPPLPTFRVVPRHPVALTRRALSQTRTSLIDLRAQPIPRQVVIRNASGRMQTITVQVSPPVAPNLVFWESGPGTHETPWLHATVVLDYEVDELGIVRTLSVPDSSCPLLEPEAVAAVSAWRFQPPLVGGKPARIRVRDRLVFGVPEDAVVPGFIRTSDEMPSPWEEAPRFAVLSLPIYPGELLTAKTTGNASIRVTLEKSGNVRDLTIIRADHAEFGHALRAAAREWRFTPAKRGGETVPSMFEIEARFTHEPENMSPADRCLPAIVLKHVGAPPVRSDTLDHKPRLIVGRQPRFDRAALAGSETGSVMLEITIDATGRVKDPVVVSASHPEYGYDAVQASASWLFEAPQVQGKPVAARVRVPFKVVPSLP